MDGYQRPLSFSERRGSHELSLGQTALVSHPAVKMPQPRLRGPPTPSIHTPAADFEQQLTGSPPPPPTPAASPGPVQGRHDWSDDQENDDYYLAQVERYFAKCTSRQRTRLLAGLFNMCTSRQLSYVHQFVSPLLKKDPFTSLPDELCLRVGHVPESCH